MYRFYYPSAQAHGDELCLPREEAHHAVNVLRVRSGEKVTVLDGAGGVLDCEVLSAARRDVRLRVTGRRITAREPFQLTLVQALLKGKAMDLIVQKATELGVSRIVPVITERTVAHLDEERAESRVEKWQGIAIEAMKQCGNPWLPRINAPTSLRQFLAAKEAFDVSLVASLADPVQSPRTVLSALPPLHKVGSRSVAVWIGPEGDFTPAEMAALRESGVQPITLGPLVLRAETAAICALAVVGAELRERRMGLPADHTD